MPYSKRVLFLGHLDRQSARSMVQGITRYAHIYGPWVFYHRIPFYKSINVSGEILLSEKSSQESLRNLLEGGKINGFIAEMPTKEMAEKVIPKGFPAVVIPVREIVPGFVNVVNAESRTGELAAEYLLGLGFKNFAFFGLASIYWSKCRENSFCQRLEKEGIMPFIFNQKESPGGMRWQEELEEIAEILKQMPRPLAIWAWNDDLAEMIIEACRILDILVPNEVCILGTDNDELFCNLCDPPLSSIALNFDRAGFELAEILDQLMKGKSFSGETIEQLPLGVIERQSTEIQASRDIEVARAIRFIRQNAHRLIQVEDVVAQIAVSRSVLYERFRSVVGCTIHEEIKRVRVETIAKALVTTNASVKEIAFNLGFSSEDHLSRYFRGIKQMSPLIYRKKFGFK